jgi:fumarate reductase subunit C
VGQQTFLIFEGFMLIILVNIVALLATLLITYIAIAGIHHYISLYQNTNDAKKIKLIIYISSSILISCLLLSCILNIKKTGYNSDNRKMEVENGIQR